MNVNKLSNRTQYSILALIATLVLTLYGIYIFAPKYAQLMALQMLVQENLLKVQLPNMPETPEDDPADLTAMIAAQKTELSKMRAELSEVKQNFAPTDNQEMLLMISEVAHMSGVKIMANEPYVATTIKGELMDKLTHDLEQARPFQRIRLEGSFTALQTFVLSLKDLPWQATIMNFDIKVSPQVTQQGTPQPVTANMIVAM